jgi:single-stranded-DNA-specific exonuclease
MYAAGMTMKPENIKEFTRRFNDFVDENIDPDMLIPPVEIDAPLLFSDITPEFRENLLRFEPFGPGNTAPVFVSRGVSNRGDAKLVGAEREHLRMDLMQPEKPHTTIAAIAFQQPTHYEYIRSGRPIDVCYTVVENHYRGNVTPQLRIKDIKLSGF